MKPWPLGVVAAIDLVLVLVFAGVGRVSHGESLSAGGLALTAGPFVGGWVLGWVLVAAVRRTRERPLGLVSGVLVWVPTVVVGMLLRVATGAGVETSFVVVATIVLGIFLLGWRGVAMLVGRVRRARLAGARP